MDVAFKCNTASSTSSIYNRKTLATNTQLIRSIVLYVNSHFRCAINTRMAFVLLQFIFHVYTSRIRQYTGYRQREYVR